MLSATRRGSERRVAVGIRALLCLAGVLALATPGRPGEDDVPDLRLRAGSVEVAWPKSVGEALPDLRLPTLDRKGAVRLSSFRGKKLLLIEFASW